MRNNAMRRNHASLSFSGLKNEKTSKYKVMSCKNDAARPESRNFPPENVGGLMWMEGSPVEPMSLSAESPDTLKSHSLLASNSPSSFSSASAASSSCTTVEGGPGLPDGAGTCNYSCLGRPSAMLDPGPKEDGRAPVDNSRSFLVFSRRVSMRHARFHGGVARCTECLSTHAEQVTATLLVLQENRSHRKHMQKDSGP